MNGARGGAVIAPAWKAGPTEEPLEHASPACRSANVLLEPEQHVPDSCAGPGVP